jgi:membrane associated rhomboid family serine protease
MDHFRPGRFQILPPVVKNLLIINVIFFLATLAGDKLGYDLYDLFGLRYFASEDFKPHQLITHMFMHGSFSHIFFNMFALWMFGYAIENFWGPKRFLIYYFVTGLGAALMHYGVYYLEINPVITAINNYLQDPSSVDYQLVLVNKLNSYYNLQATINDLNVSDVLYIQKELIDSPVVVGASGAVFGILLAFGMMFPNSVIYLYFAIPVKAKWFVILYGALELFFGLSNTGGSNIAHFAHVGGMLFGFILIKYWKIKRLN